jgi:DNA-binding LytR/AlgR family response regulator
MIQVLIIEDEKPARKKLLRFLEELEMPTEVVAEIDTIEAAILFLKSHQVDVIISDIELLDGNAFEIYTQVAITCPIIFTTAYDQFWMNAFETNGIDYLQKPFTKERFQKAWDKFLLLRKSAPEENALLSNLTKLIEQNLTEKSYKKRFTVHTHQGIYFLNIENIAYFEASEGVVFAFDTQGKKHLLSEPTLKEILERLQPSHFFRISRGELISKQHIEKIERYTKNTLAVKMKGCQQMLITSQSNTAQFRDWIDE